MKKLLFCCFSSMIIFTGCVSSQTYKKTFDESETRLTRLEKVSRELEGEKKANEILRKDLADQAALKEKEISSLKGRIEELGGKGIMTSKEIEDLRLENGRLSAADKAKAGELVSLKEELANGAKEKDYLGREVERLKVKAGEISSEKEKEISDVRNTYENLVKEMKSEIEKGDIRITQAIDRLSVNMVEKILFDSGKAELRPGGLTVIKRVGDILKKASDKQIRVEGHTDNVQIGARIRERYPTNWELSTTRATNVVRYLEDKVGVDPRLLSAAGFADKKPVAANDTVEGRAQNRRIEIVLLPLDVDRVLEELKK
ncbi:MAG: OmpA family protein [Deltaproteobacteria bacterium]|nr:OmpA family protein [Deltaproteobacteria bacterium]